MFVVTVTFKVKGDCFDDFLMAMKKQATQSLEREPGCHVFDVAMDLDQKSTVFLYEIYTDSSAFNLHLESDHFKSFDEKVAPWTDGKQVATWSLVSITS